MYTRCLCSAMVAALALGACTESSNAPTQKSDDAVQPAANDASANNDTVNSEKPAASTASSFCTASETVVFSCQTGAKQVSVCASRTVSASAGYVQYRFGDPAKLGTPLELAHPAGELHPLKAAYGASVIFSGGGGAWLRFRNPPYAYVVYSGIGRWGPNGEPAAKEGLVVEKDGVAVARLKCNSNSSGELGPDWLEKAGYTANSNEQFEFPD